MTAARRWISVAVGVLLLVATPMLVRALPVSGGHVSATALLQRIQHSRDRAFTGYAETSGNVALPASTQLTSITKLLGESNKVRVWWRNPTRWRVATLRTTGETDLFHRGDRMLRWVYESKGATVTPDVPIRFPNTVDLLPHELARRTLSGARPDELRRLPARRVAGRTALGLRLTPADPQAGVRRVDVYADRDSGVPLQVEVFANGSATPSVTTRFVDFSTTAPSASDLRFAPPHDARLRFDGVFDLASAVDRFAARVPPTSLAGLRQRPTPVGERPGAVGSYGRGPTVLLAIPLWSRTAERVREDLRKRGGVQETDNGLLLGAAPLRLLLGRPEPNGTSWLLAGTVTDQTLAAAARQLDAHPPGLQGTP